MGFFNRVFIKHLLSFCYVQDARRNLLGEINITSTLECNVGERGASRTLQKCVQQRRRRHGGCRALLGTGLG